MTDYDDVVSEFKTVVIVKTSIFVIGSLVLLLLFLFLIIALILLLPVFIFVFRANREKEKESAVYPIINHFFYKNYIFYIFFGWIVIWICCLNKDEYVSFLDPMLDAIRGVFDNSKPWHFYFTIFLVFNIVVQTHVHWTLLSLMAVQRFLLFFCPSLERYVNLKQSKMRIVIILIYLIIYSFHLVLACLLRYWRMDPTEEPVQRLHSIWIIYYFLIQLLVFATAFLYIPIVIKIRKMRHLPSVAKMKPHKYALYQTLWTAVWKLIQTIPFFYVMAIRLFLDGNTMDIILHVYFTLDVTLTPFLCQITYLFCNKRNVTTIRQRISLDYLWAILTKRNRVAPGNGIETTRANGI